MTAPRHVVVVGGGVTGLATAHTILRRSQSTIAVTVVESHDTVGGVIRTSPFASLEAVDEGADAFLTRVPWARELAEEVGLGNDLVSPRNVGAYVWRDELHPIPHELLLGVPAAMKVFATSGLLSTRGKLRASLEPLLPHRGAEHDCLGRLIREHFGPEVLEYLVDPLVGSIYAADTDHFSLEAVPQISALAHERSLLLAARRMRSQASVVGPVFAAPRGGMGQLIDATRRSVVAQGGSILTAQRVEGLELDTDGVHVVHTTRDALRADAIVLATPAYATAPIIRGISPRAADLLSRWTHASVAMITMEIDRGQWPSRLTGSGYLVPKPEQRWVTATSFGSNKWAHWNTDSRSMILRVSLGRDGRDVMGFDDETLVNLALADLVHHIDVDVDPLTTRVTRWENSFPQYRPHHFSLLREVESELSAAAPRAVMAGASYRGIGVPACIQQARTAADTVLAKLASLPQ